MVALNIDADADMVNVITRRGSRSGDGCKKWRDAPTPFVPPKKGWPTEAPPGTVEKLLVLIARENRGEELFHPYDSKQDGDFLPLMYYLEQYEIREQQRMSEGK